MKKALHIFSGILGASVIALVVYFVFFRNDASLVYNAPGFEGKLEFWTIVKDADGTPHYASWDNRHDDYHKPCWRYVMMQREIGFTVYATRLVDGKAVFEEMPKKEDARKPDTYSGPKRVHEVGPKALEYYDKILQIIVFRDGNYGILRKSVGSDFATWSIYEPDAARKFCLMFNIEL